LRCLWAIKQTNTGIMGDYVVPWQCVAWCIAQILGCAFSIKVVQDVGNPLAHYDESGSPVGEDGCGEAEVFWLARCAARLGNISGNSCLLIFVLPSLLLLELNQICAAASPIGRSSNSNHSHNRLP